MLQIIKNLFVYDPDIDAIRPPSFYKTNKTTPKTKYQEPHDYFVVAKSGQVFTAAQEEDKVFSYEQVKKDKDLKRLSDKLTQTEKQAISDAGLNLEKAIIIKPFFAKGYGRKEASKVINQKGFSESTIGKIYSILNKCQ